jgi:diguanylate cyclase (GGDEF)-like protein
MPSLPNKTASLRYKVSLTTLLTTLVSLSVILTTTIILTASYQSDKKSLTDTTLTLNHSSAQKMSRTIDSLFHSMRSSLQNIARMYTENDGIQDEKTNTYLELVRKSSNYFNSVVLVNENGLIVDVAPQSVGSAGTRITSGPVVEALELKRPYLSKPYKTVTTNRLIVFMSEPLFDKSGQFRGYVGGTIYLQESNILSMIFGGEEDDSEGSYFYVVDSDGNLLYHPDRNRIGENVRSNSVVAKLVQGLGGSEITVNSRGVYLAGYSPVPENGWGVSVLSPESFVHKQLNQHIRDVLVKALIPFVLLMLGVVWVARRLASPFVNLGNLISTMGRGNDAIPENKPHWNREADLLTKTVMKALTDVKEQTDQLAYEASTDPLTGVFNRRAFEHAIAQWTAEEMPFSILLLDIDRFKRVNDTYGHLAGDEVIKGLAKVIRHAVRPEDSCFRYGGEEFVVLLSHATAGKAVSAAERIRKAVERSRFLVDAPVTVSIGLAHYPEHAASAEQLFEVADQALYRAKESGRNRVKVAVKPKQGEC